MGSGGPGLRPRRHDQQNGCPVPSRSVRRAGTTDPVPAQERQGRAPCSSRKKKTEGASALRSKTAVPSLYFFFAGAFFLGVTGFFISLSRPPIRLRASAALNGN